MLETVNFAASATFARIRIGAVVSTEKVLNATSVASGVTWQRTEAAAAKLAIEATPPEKFSLAVSTLTVCGRYLSILVASAIASKRLRA